ncbi:MAG: OmpH family outer membrane protein [Parabacteroides sp.]
MKNINYVINGVLAVAVIVLFILQFSNKKQSSALPAFASNDTTKMLPIAYVNVDSLLQNYNFAKDLNERIVKKQEDYRASINQEMTTLQGEAADFQRKLQNNAFLTNERAEQENNRLMKKKQDLEARYNNLQNELAAEQQRLNEQLRDTIVAQLNIYNKTKGYQVIFSNTMGDNILTAGKAYDITSEILEILNKNYSSGNK